MRYSIRTSNYPKIIVLLDLTHMTSMIDLVAINMEILWIDSRYYLEKEFTELICMNPLMVLYLNVNQVDSCHDCKSFDSCHCITPNTSYG